MCVSFDNFSVSSIHFGTTAFTCLESNDSKVESSNHFSIHDLPRFMPRISLATPFFLGSHLVRLILFCTCSSILCGAYTHTHTHTEGGWGGSWPWALRA